MTIKRLTILLLLLGCGALVNLVVAWGCAVVPRERNAVVAQLGLNGCDCGGLHFNADVTLCSVACHPGRVWISQMLKDWPGTVIGSNCGPNAFAWSSVVFEEGHPLLTEIILEQPNAKSYSEVAAGWPILAFHGNWIAGGSWTGQPVLTRNGVIHLPSGVQSSWRQREMPFRPIWPGFAVNTLLYAAAIWMIFFAPFTLRRHFRVKRGRCAKCAYPAGVSNVCTECGAPVVSSRREIEQAVDHRVDEAEA